MATVAGDGGGGRVLGAVGTFVWDRIFPPGAAGPAAEQWGGVAYALAALSVLRPAGWEIRPLAKVGADLEAGARAFAAALPGVRAGEGLLRVTEANNRVDLHYRDGAEREEVLTGGVPPWRAEELLPRLHGLSALYVNFLSGYEMELETAQALRAAFRGPIYADLHSLFLGPPGAGPRPPRPLPRWREWLRCFDAVQLNESELRLLAGGAFAGRLEGVLEHGPALAVVTLGAGGARFATRGGTPAAGMALGAARSGTVPAHHALAGDPTGCGDVWGSAFLCALLGGAPVEQAAAGANAAAARKILTPRIEGLAAALAP